MIKVGDRVCLFENMSKVGTVVDMHAEKSHQWMVGASMAPIFIVSVKLDKDDAVEEYRADRLMRVD
tara:strand:- start:2647 stop:2844 length:198 start_codon:yes stop_codon:yes gene_type:complete